MKVWIMLNSTNYDEQALITTEKELIAVGSRDFIVGFVAGISRTDYEFTLRGTRTAFIHDKIFTECSFTDYDNISEDYIGMCEKCWEEFSYEKMVFDPEEGDYYCEECVI